MSQEQLTELATREITISLATASLYAIALGFLVSFIHSLPHSGVSVLAPKTWIDRYFDLITNPIYIVVEIAIVIWAMWKIRGWRFVACSWLLGMFFGVLIHKVSFVAAR